MRLGPWVADALLGEGAMGSVYRVREHGEGPAFALKVLRDASAELGMRLRREGLVTRSLDHPNVLKAHELIELNDRLGLRSDYVAGPSLAEVLSAAPPPLAAADLIAADVLAGVAAAHAAGVVHRDLKPANVLLAPTVDGWSAVVGDWGLARPDVPVDSLHTRTGMVVGTLAYLAPECLRGRPADARSDVFSLGVLLYELLAHVRPFEGDDHVQLVQRIAAGRYASLESRLSDLPTRMVDAVTAALARDPLDRPADAADLLTRWTGSAGSTARWEDAGWVETTRRLVTSTPLVSGPAHNLPVDLEAFVGREVLRERVAADLSQHRTITLTGPGGVGKTRLAVQVGHEALPHFDGGVWLADATSARTRDGIAQAVAGAFDLAVGTDPVRSVASRLRAQGSALLILDNLEQVVEHAATTVGVWSAECPELHILVTSRVPLAVPGEHLVPVDVLDAADARALFAARAARVCPGFDVGIDNQDAIGALVERLDRLPLAIEIAAARVRSRDLGRLLTRLGDRLVRLRRPDEGSAQHQRTLNATLDWSWDLLGPPERTTLAQLSVFLGGAPADAVEAVVEVEGTGVDAVLASLAKHSLAKVSGDGRAALLETVRTWARGKLDALGLTEPAEQRHALHYMDYALADRVQDSALRSSFLDEMLNLEAGARRALARDDNEAARGCLAGGWVGWNARGPRSVALELAQALMALPTAGPPDRATGLHISAMSVMETPDEGLGIPWCEEAHQICVDAGQGYAARNLLGTLVALLVPREPARAERLARSLLAESLEADDTRRVGEALSLLAWLARNRGELAAAGEHAIRALAAQQSGDDLEAAAHSLCQLAEVERVTGALDDAAAHLEQARALLEPQEHTAALVEVDGQLGELLHDRGRHHEALRVHRRVASLCDAELERPFAAAAARARVGASLMSTRGPAGALPLLERAVVELEGDSDPRHLALALAGCAVAAAHLGHSDDAASRLQRASALLAQRPSPERLRVVLASAELKTLAGDPEGASEDLALARASARALGLLETSWMVREIARIGTLPSRLASSQPGR